MLGRKLPSRCDHIRLGMSAVPWAHGPEGEAPGGPCSVAVWLGGGVAGISVGFSSPGSAGRPSAQGYAVSAGQGTLKLVGHTLRRLLRG